MAKAVSLYGSDEEHVANYTIHVAIKLKEKGIDARPGAILDATTTFVQPRTTSHPTRDYAGWAEAYAIFRMRPADHDTALILMGQLIKVVKDQD